VFQQQFKEDISFQDDDVFETGGLMVIAAQEEWETLARIPRCAQLNDREPLIDAMQESCPIREENSGDCVEILWCLVC
jgi:hypothetical protein